MTSTTEYSAMMAEPTAADAGQMGLALRQLGRQLVMAGRVTEALQSFSLCAELWPARGKSDECGLAECRFDLANALYAGGRLDEAIAEYRQALRLDPRLAPAWYNLGVALMQTASPKADAGWRDAEHAYRRALRFRPDYPEAHNNLGILLQSRRRAKEAIHHYRCAAALDPEFHEPRFNLGTLLQDEGRLEEARHVFEALLEDAPDHVDARNNLANVLSEQGRFECARKHYLHALEVRPCHPLSSWNLGLNQLRLGDWESGWRNYEWRLRQTSSPQLRSARPLWDGAPLHGSRILLTAEQGLGDTLQFVRFTQQVAARGGRIWLECQAPLASLLGRLPGVEGTVVIGDPLPDHDCWLPLLSLPYVLGTTTLETLPADVPYVSADEGRTAYWSSRLGPRTGLRVGLAWSGNPQFRVNQKRSLGEADLRRLVDGAQHPMADGALVHVFNLQKGVRAPKVRGLIELDDDPSSMQDLAAVMMNLDLILSVDTSVTHLAGALGRPVWTMLAFHADWRWMTAERMDSPWYPTMRLFRQPTAGDWPTVIADVHAALRLYGAGLAKAKT
jgi:Flp pilus assembly protein TadD